MSREASRLCLSFVWGRFEQQDTVWAQRQTHQSRGTHRAHQILLKHQHTRRNPPSGVPMNPSKNAATVTSVLCYDGRSSLKLVLDWNITQSITDGKKVKLWRWMLMNQHRAGLVHFVTHSFSFSCDSQIFINLYIYDSIHTGSYLCKDREAYFYIKYQWHQTLRLRLRLTTQTALVNRHSPFNILPVSVQPSVVLGTFLRPVLITSLVMSWSPTRT